MAWEDEALPLLRILIGDSLAPYVYCDSRLLDIFVGTARLVAMDVSFETCYTIILSTSTISPDPSDDPAFIPLVCLRAAYIVSSSEFREKSMSAVTITDGPSTISLAGIVSGLKARMDQLSKDYGKAKLQYAMGNAIGCQAVITPTTYAGLPYPYSPRDQLIY